MNIRLRSRPELFKLSSVWLFWFLEELGRWPALYFWQVQNPRRRDTLWDELFLSSPLEELHKFCNCPSLLMQLLYTFAVTDLRPTPCEAPGPGATDDLPSPWKKCWWAVPVSLGTECQLARGTSQQAQHLHNNDIIPQHHLAHFVLPQ